MSNPWDGLTPKQKKFVENYHATGNATQSYIDAGYQCTRQAAESQSCRLLRNDRIKPYLNSLHAEVTEKYKLSAEKVLDELHSIAFGDYNDALEMDENGDVRVKQGVDFNKLDGVSISKSVSHSDNGYSKSTSFSIKNSNKIKALQEIAKLEGYYDRNAGGDQEGIRDSARKTLAALKSLIGNK